MKKIMILGGNPETATLVERANAMGLYTVVVDMGKGSPAKRNASESHDIDVFEVDTIVKLAQDREVDAVLVGVADILVKPYREICEQLRMPCYATKEAIEAFSSKDGFKRFCEAYGIQDIPGIYLNEDSDLEKPEGLEYPLMIKPVDSGGGVGMKICRDDEDYLASVKTALKHSKKGVVLVEKYMDCDDMAVYYTFRNGVPYISALSDRFTTKKQGDASPVCIAAVYPSKYSALFVEQVHPKLVELFKGLKIQNGVLNIQFFVEDGVIYAYDPGFRLQGEAPDFHLKHIFGFDHREMLVNYAFSGTMDSEKFPNEHHYPYKGKSACTIWILLKGGKIESIQGLEAIKSDETVHFVLERFKTGDVVLDEWLGTERQVYARIYLVADSIADVNRKILKFQELLRIQNEAGQDMILEWIKPFNEAAYS